MSEKRASDSVAGFLFVLGLVAAIVTLIYRPFLFGPIGALVVLVGALMSGKYRRVGLAAAVIVATCFVIGAGIAVWYSRALY